VFLGSLRSETVGTIEFLDGINELKSTIQFGKVKKKPSDYFEGSITHRDKKVCSVAGSYLGYLNFDDVRYFDGFLMLPYKINIEASSLLSDHRKRPDLIALREGKIQSAQHEKDHL